MKNLRKIIFIVALPKIWSFIKILVAAALPGILLSTLVAIIYEIFFVRLSTEEMFHSRLMALAFRIGLSFFYFKTIDMWLSLWNYKDYQVFKLWFVKSFGSFYFWMSLYIISMRIVGVSHEQTLKALIAPSILCFLGGPLIKTKWANNILGRWFKVKIK